MPRTSIPLLGFFLAGLSFGWSQTPGPVLYFSDITSGPKAGNGDESSGRVAGRDGAIVTIWGVNLGAAQGDAKVVCNGADAASYYAWGNATRPANLYAYHRMQMISFQVSHLAQDGSGEIYVVVGGKKSNPLPFTVRGGNIFFLKTTGDDANGNGSWAKPWRTLPKILDAIESGDIVYVGDGVDQTTAPDSNACLYFDTPQDGTEERPKALIVYPGAVSRVGNADIPNAFLGYTKHWVIAKFDITTRSSGVYGRDGFRIVANNITAPKGDGDVGAINSDGGSNVYVLGNELRDVGSAGSSKLYHVIYVTGVRLDTGPRAPVETNKVIAWNYLHDCKANRGVDIYSEQAYSAFIQQYRVHDNVIVNQRGDGILLGYYVTGDNWIYNNLIINSGMGPEWSDPSYNTGIHIDAGHEEVPKTDIYCYNNTIYGSGFAEAAYPEQTGQVLISPRSLLRSTKVHFSNNIIYSTGSPYLAAESAVLPAGNHRNSWFGAGNAPSWDQAAIPGDPQFLDGLAKDLRLRNTSPCINTALDAAGFVTRDLLGVPRPAGAYDLGAYEYDATTGIRRASRPMQANLSSNYPNPFTRATTIEYQVPRAGAVTLTVYGPEGKRIPLAVDEQKAAGRHRVVWNRKDGQGHTVPAGSYYYELKVEWDGAHLQDVKKMLLLK